MAAYEPQLRAAAQRGNVALMEQLLKERVKEGMSVNGQDGLGNTALHYSAHHIFPETLRILLEGGADPNIQNTAGDTPLHKALVKDSLPCIELLMGHGANPSIENKEKKNASHLAKSPKAKEMTKKKTVVSISRVDMSMVADAEDTDD